MNLFATARFTLHLAISVAVLGILGLALTAPDLIPENTLWFMFALAGIGAVALFAIAAMRPKEAAAATDELSRQTEQRGNIWGYWATLAVFLAFLAATLSGNMDPKTAFYFMGFPLGLVPSLYMVWAYLNGRAG